jgi:hypothetical protein
MPVLATTKSRATVFVSPLFVPSLVASTLSAVNTSSKNATLPTGTLDGDLMLGIHSESATTGTTPVGFNDYGWTLLVTLNPGTQESKIYYKIAASEPATYAMSFGGSAPTWLASIITFRDVDRVSPIDGTPTENENVTSATMTATTVTTSNPNSMLVAIAHTNGSRTYSASTLTEYIDSGGGPSLGVFADLQFAKGASGNKTATISASGTFSAALIALRPRGGV